MVVTVIQWALAMHLAGSAWPDTGSRGDLTQRIRLYRDTAAVSERTAWRKLAQFQKCFPGEADPTALVLRLGLLDRIDSQETARSAVLSVGSMVLP